MAHMRSPTADHLQLLKDHVKKLSEARPSNRSSLYSPLTTSAIKAVQKREGFHIIHEQALPITFQDISTGNEALVLDALGFLGGLFQFMKLNTQTQVSAIELLATKLQSSTSKGQSRKLMWSMANIQFDDELPVESLKLMLNSAILYLGDKPPVHSLSTICEALNTIKNMGQRNRNFIEENMPAVLAVVFACLFNEADRIRELAFECLQPFTEVIQKGKLLGQPYQAQMKNTYYAELTKLVTTETADSLKIWGFLITAFGTEMQNVSLLNGLLKIEETALKSKRVDFRQMALEHWQYIIDCFALTPSVLNNAKRIHLIMVPLKSTETRTEEFSTTKINLWWHLLTKLGINALQRYQEVTALLLNFCFGNETDAKANVHNYPNTLPLASSVLGSILSPQYEIAVGHIKRTFPLLDSETFEKSVNALQHCCSVSLGLMEPKHRDLFSFICQAFIERCSSQKYLSQLKVFIGLIFEIAVQKPGFFEALFGALTLLLPKNPPLIEAVLTNLVVLLKWADKNEPLPTHPIFSLFSALFLAGVTWNANSFTSSLMNIFETFPTEEAGKAVVAELWTQLAITLLSQDVSVSLKEVDRKMLTVPLSVWIQDCFDDVFDAQLSALLTRWLKTDPGILEAIPSCFSSGHCIEADDRLIRLLIQGVASNKNQCTEEIAPW